MLLSSNFSCSNIDFMPSLYLTDKPFASSLHSSALFLILCDGAHPTGASPGNRNLRAP